MWINFDIKEIEFKVNEFLKNNKSKRFTASDILGKIREWYSSEFNVGGQFAVIQMLMKMEEDGKIIK